MDHLDAQARDANTTQLSLSSVLENQDVIYAQCFQRIQSRPEGLRKLAMLALTWISTAARPLSFEEVQCALRMGSRAEFPERDILRTTDDLVCLCAGLVTVGGDGQTRLLHRTALRRLDDPANPIIKNPQGTLAQACLGHLLKLNEQHHGAPSASQTGFDDYAANFWGYHLRRSGRDSAWRLAKQLMNNEAQLAQTIRAMRHSKFTDGDVSPLHIAAYFNSKTLVELAFQRQTLVDVEAKTDSAGQTALHWAAFFGSEKAMDELLDRKADIWAVDTKGCTSLHVAATVGNNDCVESLLDRASAVKTAQTSPPVGGILRLGLIDQEDWQWCTPLRLAARAGQRSTVELLLDRGADIHHECVNGYTALRCAAYSGQREVVELLVRRGADVNRRTKVDQWLLLQWAAETGEFAIAQLLLTKWGPKLHLNAVDASGVTPLMGAFRYGHGAVAWVLLQAGAAFNPGKRTGHRTALQLGIRDCAVAKWADPTLLWLLLERSPDAFQESDAGGCTPLHVAAEVGNIAFMQLLLEKGADANREDKCGLTPLHYAARYDQRRAIEVLLRRGVDGCKTDSNRQTALHWAVIEGHVEAVKALLRHSGSLDMRDEGGQTALHLAARSGHDNLVKLLLELKVDVNAQDHSGRTPLHAAAQSGSEKLVRLLLSRNADASIRENGGRTPKEVAEEDGLEWPHPAADVDGKEPQVHVG